MEEQQIFRIYFQAQRRILRAIFSQFYKKQHDCLQAVLQSHRFETIFELFIKEVLMEQLVENTIRKAYNGLTTVDLIATFEFIPTTWV